MPPKKSSFRNKAFKKPLLNTLEPNRVRFGGIRNKSGKGLDSEGGLYTGSGAYPAYRERSNYKNAFMSLYHKKKRRPNKTTKKIQIFPTKPIDKLPAHLITKILRFAGV